MNPAKHRSFVSLLRKAESKKATSERHLSRLLGVRNSDIRRWKEGKGSPDIEVLERLAKLLRMDMNALTEILNTGIEVCVEEDDNLSQKKILQCLHQILEQNERIEQRVINNERKINALLEEIDRQGVSMKITEMIALSISTKTEEILRKRVSFLREPEGTREFHFTWEEFQSFKNGQRKLKTKTEVKALYQIVDPEGQYFSLVEWYRALERCREYNLQHPSDNDDPET